MALDFGLEELGSATGALGSTGLGDFQLPDNIISNQPPSTPDLSGLDFASLGDTGANALGATFSDAGFGGGGGGGLDLSGAATDFGGGAGGADALGASLGTGSGGIGSDYASSGGSPASLSPLAETTDLSAQTQQPSPADTTQPDVKKEGLSPLAKTAILASPALAAGAFTAARGPYVPPAAKQLNAEGANMANFSAQFQQMYNSGQIQGSAAAMITSNYLGNVSKINQFYASSGQWNSTQRLGALQKAQADMTTQYQAFLDSELKAAMTASGQAGQFFAAAANIQLKADQNFQAALTSVFTGIGKVAAMQMGGAKPTVSF